MANLELTKLRLSSWRKIALGTWNRPGDPSVYATMEFRAQHLLDKQKRWVEKHGEKAPTITCIVAKSIAMTMSKHPQLNGMIRWGQIYLRSGVTVFLQTSVDEAGQELSGVVIQETEKKSLDQIQTELKAKARAIREDKDPTFKKAKSSFGRIPTWLMRYVLNSLSFALYALNIDLSFLGLPKDPFGSVMVTSVGMLGIDEGYAPLVPYSRVPVVLAVGAIRDQAIVEQGKLAIAPIFKVCATFDHRFIDGVYAAKMSKTFRYYLETAEGLAELGL